MSLLKRRVARRAAGVGVGVALLVLGLEAPAFAVAPTIASFTPTSGPAGCVVAITGTNFTNPAVTSVKFGTTAAASIAVKSDTEIWAEAPALAAGSYTVHVTNGDGTANSSSDFVVPASGAGSCAPTVTSFTPTCGPSGTVVAITGTNLMKTATAGANVYFGSTTTASSGKKADETAPATPATLTSRTVVVPATATSADTGPIAVATFNNVIGQGGAFSTTKFTVGTCITSFTPTSGNPGDKVTITGVGFTGATAVDFHGVQALFTVNSDTEIVATVPLGATTGPITVVSPGGTVTSSTDFTVGVTGGHSRNISLRLRRHLIARGKVTVPDGTTACAASVPVLVQRRVSGHWKTVGRTTTGSKGGYHKRIRNKHGKYRSVAPRFKTSAGDLCKRAVSPTRTH